MRRNALSLALAVGLAAPAARADVKPHPLFSDGAVLQRGEPIAVFGTAEPGEEVQVSIEYRALGTARASGSGVRADGGGHWKVSLKEQPAGTGYTLTVKGKNEVAFKDVAVGDVWVCSGQSNMGMNVNGSADAEAVKASSKDAKLRLFTVKLRASMVPLGAPEGVAHLAKWVEAGPETVGPFSAVAYHFGATLRKRLTGDVPVGLILSAWGGTPGEAWVSKDALNAVPELRYYHDRLPAAIEAYGPAKAEADWKAATVKWKAAAEKAKAEGKKVPSAPQKAVDPKLSQNTPSNLFNAMIHPLLPFPVRGVIWYQGEANGGRAYEYRTLLPTLIKDWRAHWGRELPFFVVQLAPWSAGFADGVQWAELREAQYLATKALPKVGLAVITDVGDRDDVHPKRKKPVGERLALSALAVAYGEAVEANGPTFKEMKVEGDKAVLSFDHLGGGLVCKGDALTGFAVAGEDRKFHPAEAAIRGDAVVVHCNAVPRPTAVRFGWKNYPEVNLFNAAGLPAVPFRTDDFPWTTAPKK